MAKLLTITHAAFKEEMDAHFSEDQAITSLDVFDAFVAALEKDTNVLDSKALKALVFNQFKSYGDFDKIMNEVAQRLTEINESTGDAIKSSDNKDTGALTEAYSKLKVYQKRIDELEQDMYTDDVTGVYNRKYLLNHELAKDETFKAEGHLMRITINNFLSINKEHGHESGDAVLKFVAISLEKRLKSIGIHLIRSEGIRFIALVKPIVSKKAEKVFEETVNKILKQKFKTHAGKILNIEVQFAQHAFNKGENFHTVYDNLE